MNLFHPFTAIKKHGKQWGPLAAILAATVAMLGLALNTPAVWATPAQHPLNQTIPPGACPQTQTYEIENTPVTYSGVWDFNAGEAGDRNGQLSLSTATGAKATFTFTGVSLDLIVRTEPLGGYASVLIDGSQGPFVVEFFSSTKQYQVLKPIIGNLSNTAHTVEITVTDNPLFPTRRKVLLDAYQVGIPALGSADPFEPDNNVFQATPVSFNTSMTGRKLDSDSDQDWISFNVQAGEVFTITTSNLAAGTDTVLTLYDTDGSTELAKSDDVNWPSDLSSQIVFTASQAGTYYALVTPFPNTGSCSTSYDLSLSKQWKTYLPLILKNDPAPTPTPTSTPSSPSPTPTPTATPVPAVCAPLFLGTVIVQNQPRGMAIDSTRRRIYVANYGSNSISVINTTNNSVVTTITGITAPHDIALDPDNNLLWVTNYNSDTVTPISLMAGDTFQVNSPLSVGDGPWGIEYMNGGVYVANRLGHTVTVINAATQSTSTLSGSFTEPAYLVANPLTNKVYVTNFSGNSVTAISAGGLSTKVINISRSQPYGLTVDSKRNLVYAATVNSNSLAAIDGATDTFLGYATFQRGFNPARPAPLRVLAFNPNFALNDGGHLWTTTATGDGSEKDQALLIPKGWASAFHVPVPHGVGPNPRHGIAIDLSTDRIYVTSEGNNTVTVLGDNGIPCFTAFSILDASRSDEIISVLFKSSN